MKSNFEISNSSSLPISKLIKHIKYSFLERDFNKVQNILMERENDLKIEIGNLTRDRDSAKEEVRLLERNGDLVELERLNLEAKLRKSRRKCEKLEKNVARLLEEIKESNDREKKRRDKIIAENTKMTIEKNKLISELNDKINELKNRNLENERLLGVYQEKCKCLDIKIVKMDQEIESLTREKLDAIKTIEELRAENIKANKAIDELKLKKSESDKVAEVYKKIGKLATWEERVNLEFPGSKGENDSSGNGDAAEIVAVNATSPGDCKSSISSGSKNFGLSKKGSACGTHTLIPGAGRFSKIARSSSAAAAGDIIEIIDSDNETNPDRAADVSNVGVNEMNFVRSPSCSKRNGIDVDNVLLIHEARPASDSQTPLEEFDGLNDDEVSTDSDDSCTDSRMDDLIASFRSKAAENRSRR